MTMHQPSVGFPLALLLLTTNLGFAAVGCGEAASGDQGTTGMGSTGDPSAAGSAAGGGATQAGTATAESGGSAGAATGTGDVGAPATGETPMDASGGASSAGASGASDDGSMTPPALGGDDSTTAPGAAPGEMGTMDPATTDPTTIDPAEMDPAEMDPAEMGEPGALDPMDAPGGMDSPDDPAAPEEGATDEGAADTTDPADATEEPAEAPTDTSASFGPDLEGSCTESQPANSNASGSGPYDVVVETNSDPGINEGTIFRPADLSGAEPFPIFVWGEGGCSQNGLSNASAMAEIASPGYFVVADGTPNGSGSREMDSNDIPSMGEPLLAYVDWALAENSKPCSAYYHTLDASKIASNGFSCGGLMSSGTAGDPRMTTWGSTSSGTFSVNQAFYESIHTPVLIIEGGPSDIAYENGLRDYDNIAPLGHTVMFFSKDIGHGGDLFQGGSGDFTKINLAWLNWWLKGDEGATGKGVLVGDTCTYCTDSEWEVMSANMP